MWEAGLGEPPLGQKVEAGRQMGKAGGDKGMARNLSALAQAGLASLLTPSAPPSFCILSSLLLPLPHIPPSSHHSVHPPALLNLCALFFLAQLFSHPSHSPLTCLVSLLPMIDMM